MESCYVVCFEFFATNICQDVIKIFLSCDALESSFMSVQVGWSLFMSSKGISAMEPSARTQPSMQNRYSGRWIITGWESGKLNESC